MTNVQDVEFLSFAGKKPSEKPVMKVIESKREEGLELADMQVETIYLSQSGIEKYLVTMLFKESEDEITNFVEDTEREITEELGGELDDELL